MSLLVKIKDRQNGQPVVADDDDNEFLNIIDVLAGQNVGKSIRIVNSDSNFAAARLDQNVGSGNIAEFFKQGTSKSVIDNNGNLNISHSSPFVVLNDTDTADPDFIINYNSNVVIGRSGQSDLSLNMSNGVYTFGQQPVLPKKLITFSIPFRVEDPSTFPLNDDSAAILVRVPAITGGFISKITIIRPSGVGSHTAGGSVTFRARKFNDSNIGNGVSFDDTNNAANTPYSEDFADVSISEGNLITFHISARSGTVSERNVTINIEGYRELH